MSRDLRRPGSAEKSVTLRDIAEHCGVSKQTVSRVFLDDARISAATVAKVRASAAELGYNPSRHQAARRMALRKVGLDVINQVVAVFFPPYIYRSNYATELFWGMWEGMNRAGFSLLVIEGCDPQTYAQPALPQVVTSGEVDGALVMSRPEDFLPTLELLRREEQFGARPIVSMIWPLPGCHAVTTDDTPGAYAAMQHLLAQGHRRLLHYVSAPTPPYPEAQRAAAYAQACRDAGLAPAAVLHTVVWDERREAEALAEIPVLLRAHPDLTAILARNDREAVAIAGVLAREGRRVPADISLLGFDDTDPLPGDAGQNILSTVALPLHALGLRAAELLVQQVSAPTALQQVALPATFVPRASTAPR
jgi:DNA-binding LacI/PurR family transcriptional regulator